MTPALRRVVLLFAFAIAATGIAWFVLQQCCREATAFGSVDSPWLPAVRLAHGVVSLLGLFVIGWVGGTHAWPKWQLSLLRATGAWLAAPLLFDAGTGVGLLYVAGETSREWFANGHVVLGAVLVGAFVVHWVCGRRSRVLREAVRRAC